MTSFVTVTFEKPPFGAKAPLALRGSPLRFVSPIGGKRLCHSAFFPAPLGGRMSEACYIAVAITKRWLYSLVIVILAVGFKKHKQGA